MLTPAAAVAAFEDSGLRFWTGVPDSLLKDFCAYVDDPEAGTDHVIAANEGGAIALAVGHHLATGQPAGVYLQNSGLGNTLNPLVSLAAPEVYGIPMVAVIGWRGEPGTDDEPQHMKQGAATMAMLESAGVPHTVLSSDPDDATSQIGAVVASAVATSSPHAIVVPAGTFTRYTPDSPALIETELTREQAVGQVADAIGEHAVIVATTGKTSRELWEHRDHEDSETTQDFLTVGGMGHASQIALGIDLAGTGRDVWVFDGDGAVVMHMGSLAVIGQHASPRFRHVVFNNGVHDSVGGQPTPTQTTSLPDLALACGYRAARTARTADEIGQHLTEMHDLDGPTLLEIVVRPGARSDLGRPRSTPTDTKQAFMRHISGS